MEFSREIFEWGSRLIEESESSAMERVRQTHRHTDTGHTDEGLAGRQRMMSHTDRGHDKFIS